MEYRTQTYIGAVQLLAILSGSLILRAAVHGAEGMLASYAYEDGRWWFLGLLSRYGWGLILIPVAWVLLTILGERSQLWWATKFTTILSGTIILLGIVFLFGWAGWTTYGVIYGGF